ncbi:MAG: metal-dependent hydrolase [Bacteroidia bacterium]|nr:metal-dependent hydrolase [Bacteroidia bacterium]
MDIVNNIVAGCLGASFIASATPARPARQIKIILSGIIGGIFPDIDGLSLMTSADSWCRTLLGISGENLYFGHHALSHLGFFHSLMGLVVCTLGAGLLTSWIYFQPMRHAASFVAAFRYLLVYIVAFGLGYVLHLAGDLAGPAGIWGGVRLFFPYEAYVGGWGHLWWWNNYDIFLILAFACILNLGFMLRYRAGSRLLARVSALTVCLALILAVVQVVHRGEAFNEGSFSYREEYSRQVQQQILGPGLYHWMEELDYRLPVLF